MIRAVIEKDLKRMQIDYYKKIIRNELLEEEFDKTKMQNEIDEKRKVLQKIKKINELEYSIDKY